MRILIEGIGQTAVLKGIGSRLTPEILAKVLENEGGERDAPGSPSFDPRLVENGGEAWVRLIGNTALRFDRRLLSPDVAEAEKQRFLGKMEAMKHLLPLNAIAPKLPIYVDGHPGVVGHTMEYVESLQLFKDAAKHWDGSTATEALLAMHTFITRCHASGVILGEVNPRNFGLSRRRFVAIDTLTYGVRDFPCLTAYQATVDPTLLNQDESANEGKGLQWLRTKPYTPLSDWYGFCCIVLEVFIGVGPWAGTHHLAPVGPELRSMRVRALRGLSIFDPDIEIADSRMLRTPEALGAPLYNYLYEVFNKRRRDVFPVSLLRELRWTRCTACDREIAVSSCPCGGTRS